MTELEGDLVSQIEGVGPFVSPGVEASAASFVANMKHLEEHGMFADPSTNPTPLRRGFNFENPSRDEYIAELRGVDWIGAGQDDGSFLSPVSDEEVEAVARTGSVLLPERYPLAMADLFPEAWDGTRVVYDITVRARRLTEMKTPIALKEGEPQEPQGPQG